MVNRVDQRLAYLARKGFVSRLQPYSVLNAALARHAVLNQNIADGAVGSEEIADGGVEEGNMADDSISTRTIQADSITANEIAANTITADEIMAGTITAEEIAANTITADEIAAGTITAEEIAAYTITGDNIIASVQLSAPVMYGGGARVYDVINPDPAIYPGADPSPGYVAIAGATWSGGTPTIRTQVTCYNDGRLNLTNTSGDQFVYINGWNGSSWAANQAIATRQWVINGYQPAGSYASGGHTHTVSVSGSGTFTTSSPSDERLKKDIEPLDVGLAFIESLNPVKYKFIDGSDAPTLTTSPPNDHDHDHSESDHSHEHPDKPGVRTHYGLIAQQVKEVIDSETEDDFAGWVHTEDDVQMLRYNEFIAPLIKAVQELAEQNRNLQERIDRLEAGID